MLDKRLEYRIALVMFLCHMVRPESNWVVDPHKRQGMLVQYLRFECWQPMLGWPHFVAPLFVLYCHRHQFAQQNLNPERMLVINDELKYASIVLVWRIACIFSNNIKR